MLTTFELNDSFAEIEGMAEEGKRRGRASEIGDGQLDTSRYVLTSFFQANWGAIGYQLQRVKRRSDLEELLSPLSSQKEYQQGLRYLFAFDEEVTDPETYRRTRKQFGQILTEHRESAEKSRELEELVTVLERGSGVAAGDDALRIRLRLKQERERLDQLHLAMKEFESQRSQFEKRIERQRAYLFSTELFDFLKSKRYTITPDHLGRATAGLPYMTWRQSIKRCAKFDSSVGSLEYEMFLTIKAICGHASNRSIEMLFRDLLLSNERIRRMPGAIWLRKRWRYLRRALSVQSLRRDRLPYQIMAAFQTEFNKPRDVVEQALEIVESLQ